MHRLADKADPGPFHYRLFGLNVESELELPELSPVEPSDEPDVRIGITAAGPHPGTLVAIDDVAKFYVEGGLHIRIVPEPAVPDRNVRLFLLGSAMGMLLHQRGLLPLHANAIEIDGKAVAFMGPSGAGKSTLAAWFHDRGYRVIADDVCVVDFTVDGHPTVFDGLPRLRLWRDALEDSGRRPEHFARSYSGDASYDKYDVPLRTIGGGPRTLAATYVLERGEPAVIRLPGLESVESVFANTYRGHFLDHTGGHDLHMRACVKLVQSVPVFRWTRQWEQDQEDRMAAILDHVRTATL
jgi:hypothetical protein